MAPSLSAAASSGFHGTTRSVYALRQTTRSYTRLHTVSNDVFLVELSALQRWRSMLARRVRAYLPAEELWSLICLDCAEHRMILCTKMSISNRKIRLKLRRTRNLRVLVLRVQGLEPTRNRSAAVSRVHPSHWL